MAEPAQATKTVYHKEKGGVSMYAIDAHHAVRSFPDEWSFEPWDSSEGPNLANGEPRAVIPNGWVDLAPSARIKLARDLGGKDIRSGAQADDFINEYLVARANAGASQEPARIEPLTENDGKSTDGADPAK